MGRSFSQPELIGGILKWLEEKGGVKWMNTRQMNAVVAAANDIIAALDRPHVPAIPGMGLARWLTSDDTGRSSKYMVHALAQRAGCDATYVEVRDGDYPHDPDDFGRCVRLLDAVPQLRPHLPLLSGHGAVWAAIAAEWDSLETMYREDEPTGKSARLLNRLRELHRSGA